MAQLFFSYSHRDEDLRDQLDVHLAMLKRQGVVETWHDRRIVAGAPFVQEIDANLDAADVILLLLSPDFLASDYCYDIEVKRAMERHIAGVARVIPVVLRPCDWQDGTPFRGLMAVPKDGKPVTKWPNLDDAFLDITKAIRSALETGKSSVSRPVQPAPSASNSAVRPTTNESPVVRSSNLRIAKEFNDRDRDTFLTESFNYIAKLFEGSLSELKDRHRDIDFTFRRIDADHFSAVIYRSGNAVARCRIWLGGYGGPRASQIMYSMNDAGTDNSCNEMMSVGDDRETLFLRPAGMQAHRNVSSDGNLTMQGAAEYYWAILVGPLQR
ncbi:MAG: toll/interleukin-1 receptor domain-containing protein [Roseiarcus sp.]